MDSAQRIYLARLVGGTDRTNPCSMRGLDVGHRVMTRRGHDEGTAYTVPKAEAAEQPRWPRPSPVMIFVETRGIEPLTPALQRQCSAN